ncbi:MAG: sigma-70 family RNA polymerase sigma factor [Cyanobacteria bacterium K_DeepCast_35m_m2_155]|nr:sigma-70 family RNA polymerase sigma factor [Cyanobacteria bacterium K_DeepCast_35m_m2_155]
MANSAARPTRSRRDQLMLSGLELVKPIAVGYARQSNVILDDLIQVGAMGLLRAAERFESSSGMPFGAFARPHIRGAILHYLRDQAHFVRLPRRMQEWRQQQRPGMGASQSPRERPGASLAARHQLLHQWTALSHPESLDAIEALDAHPTSCVLAEGLAQEHSSDDQTYRPKAVSACWTSPTVHELLDLVPSRQKQVLKRVVLNGWSYRRTAQAMGVSAPTVQRLLKAGLAQLRQQLGQQGSGALF